MYNDMQGGRGMLMNTMYNESYKDERLCVYIYGEQTQLWATLYEGGE